VSQRASSSGDLEPDAGRQTVGHRSFLQSQLTEPGLLLLRREHTATACFEARGLNHNSGAGGALMSLIRMRAFALGVTVAVIGVCASPAWGAFPGRDGDLVVATGGGLELVVPATGAASAICSDVLVCGHPAQPSFSPNGQAIALSIRPAIARSWSRLMGRACGVCREGR
jgi:hypothetical protein